MRQPKKLTRVQKLLLSKLGKNANDYMYLDGDKDSFIAIHKQNKEDRITIAL